MCLEQIFMDISNLKNSIMLVFLISLLHCSKGNDQNYALLNEFPPISIKNGDEGEVKQIVLYLKRNTDTIDTGNFTVYSKSGSTIDVQIGLKKKDSLYIKDEILFRVRGKKFTITDFQKKKVKSSGDPYIISYKINEKLFMERSGYIELK